MTQHSPTIANGTAGTKWKFRPKGKPAPAGEASHGGDFPQHDGKGGNIVEAEIGHCGQRIARAGSRQHPDPETHAGVFTHAQIMAIVSHNRHLPGIEPGCGAKAEHHAGLRLRAEAAVIAGNEIEMAANAETLRSPADR